MKKLSSATLLHALAAYGSPAALAADNQAEARLAAWGGRFLKEEKRQRLLASAAGSVGNRGVAREERGHDGAVDDQAEHVRDPRIEVDVFEWRDGSRSSCGELVEPRSSLLRSI